MKMRLGASTGEECPGGSVVFHTTFFEGPNSVGSPEVAETPEPFGPRNCVQSSAAVDAIAAATINDAVDRARRMLLVFDIETCNKEVRPRHIEHQCCCGVDSSRYCRKSKLRQMPASASAMFSHLLTEHNVNSGKHETKFRSRQFP